MRKLDLISIFGLILLLLVPTTVISEQQKNQSVRLFNADKYPLNLSMGVLEDKKNRWTIQDITSEERSALFVSTDEPILNLGYSSSTFWLRIRLDYPNAAPNKALKKDWYLEVGRSQLNLAELYLPIANNDYQIIQSDIRMPFEERAIKHFNSVFPVTTILGQDMTLYLRLKSNSTIHLPVVLWEPTGFSKKVAKETFIYGLFYGGMLIILLYNLFVYFVIRDISYLFYVLYLGGVLIFQFVEIGHSLLFFEHDTVFFEKTFLPFHIWFSFLMAMFFMRNFLDTKHYHPRIDPMIKALMIIMVINSVLSFFVDFQTSISSVTQFSILFVPFFLTFSYYSFRKGNENARFFFFGWLVNVAGMLTLAIAALGIIPTTPLTLAAVPMGTLGEAVILSFALADRIKRAQQSALNANLQAMDNLSNYRLVFENAIEGMYQMSLIGRLIHANPAMAKMLGFDGIENLMSSKSGSVSLLYPDPPSQYERLLKTGRLQNEICCQHQDAAQVWVTHSAQLVRDRNGNPTHIEGTLSDITQHKERKMAQLEMIREKANKDIAYKAAAEKSAFIATMSHEIRTPLTSIIGFSESLKDSYISSKEKQLAIDIITDSCSELMNLINDILDFSKIEAKRLQVESLPVDFFELINSLCSRFEIKARDRQLSFGVKYNYPLPKQVITDPTRLTQVLTYLCGKALESTEQGSITMDVSWSEKRGQMQFLLSDTGKGFTEAQCDTFFQVFSQADTSAMKPFDKTGLRLVIAKQLIELMGGIIEVESTIGIGTRITFFVGSLTNSDVSNRNTWISCPDAHEEKSNRSVLGKKTNVNTGATTVGRPIPLLDGNVLLAEDNVVNQQLIQRVVQKTGARVSIAKDGKEAVEMSMATPFDLILMDINMPIMGGLEATRILRLSGKVLPIYALTAELGKAEAEASSEAGCNGHLTKPLDIKALRAVLQLHLNTVNSSNRNETMATNLLLENSGNSLSALATILLARLSDLRSQILEALSQGNSAKLKTVAYQLDKAVLSFDSPDLAMHTQELTLALNKGQNKKVTAICSMIESEIQQAVTDSKGLLRLVHNK